MADSLEDYLSRHPEYIDATAAPGVRLLTTGDESSVARSARVFWPDAPAFVSTRLAA